MENRNQKATLLTTVLYVSGALLVLFGALVNPETRITGVIHSNKKVNIPAWLQTEPEYQSLKNVKVDQGWGGGRLFLWLLAIAPIALGVTLSAERQAEIEKERLQAEFDEKERKAIADVNLNHRIELLTDMLDKTKQAKVALHEDKLVEEVATIREANGWLNDEPAQLPPASPPASPPAPPIVSFQPPTGDRPQDGFKDEIMALKEQAIARINLEKVESVEFYQEIGRKVLHSMGSLTLSILSAAPTGAGKSTTMESWLKNLTEKSPDAKILVIAQKKDSFLGLADIGMVQKFNAEHPEKSLSFLDTTYAEMHRRLDEPERDRPKYANLPLRLVLDDWHATYSILKLDTQLWASVRTKLNQIVTLGREVNVNLYISTQSYNLVTLGLVEDSGIRSNLAITCQGFVKQSQDGGGLAEQGDYTVIQMLIKNQYIVPSKVDRERLSLELDVLMKLSAEAQVPVIFSAIGRPTLGLLPHHQKASQDVPSTGIIPNSNSEDEPIKISDEEAREWASNFGASFLPEDTKINDSIGIPACDEVINHDCDDSSDEQKAPDFETKNWYKWMLPKQEIIAILEKNDANYYSLAYIVRVVLKKTDIEYNRKAKAAIAQLLKDLNRQDLIAKYDIRY